jgi:hypothetical protein
VRLSLLTVRSGESRSAWPLGDAQSPVGIVPRLSELDLLPGVEPVLSVECGLRRWEVGTMEERTDGWKHDPRSFAQLGHRSGSSRLARPEGG